MSLPSPEKAKYTYEDYLKWPEEERWELIDGVPYNMSPSPSREHQRISIGLSTQIYNFLADKECEVYNAPFEVRLPETGQDENKIKTVVQPDIVVVCAHSKLDDRGCKGAPDFVIEIISPSTASKDHIQKLALYERHGVKEYWIVDPLYKLVIVRLLNKSGKYDIPGYYEGEGELAVATLHGLILDLNSIFGP